MRRGYTNLWKYDGFPRNAESTVSIDGEKIPLDELPGTFIEREYVRRFGPSYEPPATNEATNAIALARFHKVSGKAHKVSKAVGSAPTITRREETYARLAEKMRGNKWFDENAS